jgi:hypothetical protein
MSEPKPTPPEPKREGGLKSTDKPQTEDQTPESGMVTEGDRPAAPRDERPGGMIGEG